MRHLPHLDSLRALAIGLVLIEHWGGPLARAWFPIGGGDLGVNLFFVLSGFLITSILLEQKAAAPVAPRAILRRFYLRRLFRLAPALFLTLLVGAALNLGDLREDWWWHALHLSNLYTILGGEKTVFWSLAVEENFYLLWPLLLLAVPQARLRATLLGLIGLGLLWKLFAWSQGWPLLLANLLLPGNLETLGTGCLLACLTCQDGRPLQFGWYRGRVALGFAAIAWSGLLLAILSWLALGKPSQVRFLSNDLLTAPIMGWLVLHAGMGWRGLAGRVADLAPLRQLGRISYGVYLVHTYQADALTALFGPLPYPVLAVLVPVVTFAWCAASWRWLEQPMQRFAQYRLERGVVRLAENPRLQQGAGSDYAASSTAERHAAKASGRKWRWVAAEIR